MSVGPPWVVIPAFRAEATLGAVLDRVPPWLAARGGRIVVVDDGSGDGTGEVARGRGVTVLVNERNRGYARSQKRGIAFALDQGAAAVAILHADGQYPPEALPAVLEPVLSGAADVVLGSRVLDGGARRRGMPAHKFLANRALSWLENRCYGLELSEYHTGMMVYSRGVLEAVPFAYVSDTFHFDGEMAMLAGRRGYTLLEVPIEHVYAGERSYLRPVPYVLAVVAIALSVRIGLYDRWVEGRARSSRDER
jgi:glycosyltransferase involved in cell wall biosynthesis